MHGSYKVRKKALSRSSILKAKEIALLGVSLFAAAAVNLLHPPFFPPRFAAQNENPSPILCLPTTSQTSELNEFEQKLHINWRTESY